jgi:hypothetical protein
MVHTTNGSLDGEATHARLEREVVKNLAQSKRQRRCKQQQKNVVHNVLAIVVEPV